MKTLRLIFTTALASLCLAAVSTYGAMTFDFSSTFPALTGEFHQPQLTVWGSLAGDLSADGKFVEHVSIVSVFFNQIQAPGTYCVALGSVVSFSADLSNFLFSDPPRPDQDFGTWRFAIQNGGVASINYNPDYIYQYGGNPEMPMNYSGGSWSLTAVPEPTTMIAGALALLPFGLQGIRFLRTRKQTA
jgi:hypothetical protein